MLVKRAAQVWYMPVVKAPDMHLIESAVLRFSNDVAFDVGALCYAIRGPKGSANQSGKNGSKAERLVALQSFDSSRRDPIRTLIEFLNDSFCDGTMRLRTAEGYFRAVLNFLDWADDRALQFPLRSPAACEIPLAEYMAFLEERVRTGALKRNSGAQLQLTIVRFFADFFPTFEPFLRCLKLIHIAKNERNPTEPPSEASQAHVLAIANSLFQGLSDLVINNKPYPHAIQVPQFLGAKSNLLWCFPCQQWCMPPHSLRERDLTKSGNWAWDFENGRTAIPSEILDRYAACPGKQTKYQAAQRAVSSAQSKLESANTDSQYESRRRAAQLACNAFIVLFIANTGMNWATVQQLDWSPTEFDIGTERQGFRTIKFRAQGRQISFEIQPVFLPQLRLFLRLREYLLQGSVFGKLFFATDSYRNDFRPLTDSAFKYIVAALKEIDPDLPSIMTKQWRAGKSDWLLRHTDPATAALVLQNSVTTVLRSYAAGSPTAHADEMGAFLSALERTVLDDCTTNQKTHETPIGSCSSIGSPKAIGNSPIAVNCMNAEGCLYCENFRVHADEYDTRKLLSCQACLQQASKMASSEEQFQTVFAPIFKMIESLLQEIERRSVEMVRRIRQEVLEGELDPYWSRKLEMLLELRLIS
jgi:integrase